MSLVSQLPVGGFPENRTVHSQIIFYVLVYLLDFIILWYIYLFDIIFCMKYWLDDIARPQHVVSRSVYLCQLVPPSNHLVHLSIVLPVFFVSLCKVPDGDTPCPLVILYYTDVHRPDPLLTCSVTSVALTYFIPSLCCC